MKITFVLPYADLSGGIKVVALHAKGLEARGHRVVVVSTPPRRPGWRERVRGWLGGGRRPAEKGSHFDGLGVDHRVVAHPAPVTEEDVPDADVVVATWWKTARWVEGFGPRKGAKALFIQGYEVLPGEENPELDATWRLPFQKIVVARWLKALAEERFGDAGARLATNAVDPAQFHAPPRGKQPAPTVGFLYSGSPFKGVDRTLDAVARLRARFPALRVLAFGAVGPKPDLPLPPGCEFHERPAQETLRDLYARCDVWLCGSRREGFHLPILEAMACRCPVVSTPVGGADEAVEPGVNGFLAEDAASMADAAARVLSADEAAWRSWSDAAHATSRRYRWDDAVAAMEDALKAAVERAAPPAGKASAR
jgi:glycosyltransferase involved in cell wall biosynthesis